MDKFDFKKEYKEFYLPKKKPEIVTVTPIQYFMVDGEGNPNTSKEYADALEILYGLTFTIKMSKMSKTQPEGYFEYVVPPLEGLWNIDNDYFNGCNEITDKRMFKWTSMIAQPEFITQDVLDWAKEKLHVKKPELKLDRARLEVLNEGLCVQMMHIGSFDDEAASIFKMEEFVKDNEYITDINDVRRHHEIYLGDPRKTASEKMRTVIRHPIRKA